MIVCPNCKKKLKNGSKFCDRCGTPVYETIICPECGEQMSAEFEFCKRCGAQIRKPDHEEKPESPKKKLQKKYILLGGIGAAVVAVLIVAAICFGGNAGDPNYALYLKDQEIFYTNLEKDDENWQITSRLADDNEIDVTDYRSIYADLTYVSKNGDFIIYPDKDRASTEGHNLYYRSLKDPESEAVKIDSGVSNYSVNDAEEVITYWTSGDDLYQYTIKEDEQNKIDSNIDSYVYVSADGVRMGYQKEDGDLYVKEENKEPEKIDGNVTEIVQTSDDLSTIYYLKGETLYKKVTGEDKVKISSDIYDVISIYDTGEMYYLKENPSGERGSLLDYVEDDLAEADAAMIEPEEPEMPSRSILGYDSMEDYEAARDAYNARHEAYEEEMEAYREKEERDALREELAAETVTETTYTLCFYDGAKESMITDSYFQTEAGGITADEAPVIYFDSYEESAHQKVKLSEIESIYDISVYSLTEAVAEEYIAVGGKASQLKQDVGDPWISDDGRAIYFMDQDSVGEDHHGDLYMISVKDGTVGKPELYDEDVSPYWYIISDGQLLYLKDYDYYYDDNVTGGELYVNKEKIDDDVFGGYEEYHDDSDTLLYYTDWDSERQCGTLKMYQNGEVTKIADDVYGYNYSMTPDGRILYLYDYNIDYHNGELCEWKDGETRKIADDVYYILQPAL